MTNSYDRRGRQSTIVRNGTTTTFAYNNADQQTSESYSGGTLGGLSVTNGYDLLMRRTNCVVLNGTTVLSRNTNNFDAAGRFALFGDGSGNSATYSYLANSPLVSQIVFKQNGTTRMTTTKNYDYLNRLTSVSSAPSAASAVSFSYGYNSANERIRRTEADNSYWLYNYDSLGQVTSGKRYWSDESPVAGQQFQYAFDDIGNHTSTKAGGDQNEANLRSANYSANNLNQYTSRDVPGDVDIMGVGVATTGLTVNGTTAYRRGEYFRQQVSVSNGSNGSAPVWEGATVAQVGQGTNVGNLFVAQTPESFGYDSDGNLTNDGRFTYTWDGENRLLTIAARTYSEFVERYDLTKPPWGSLPEAGGLPSMSTPPSGWSDSGKLLHFVSVEYECCCAPYKKTKITALPWY